MERESARLSALHVVEQLQTQIDNYENGKQIPHQKSNQPCNGCAEKNQKFSQNDRFKDFVSV